MKSRCRTAVYRRRLSIEPLEGRAVLAAYPEGFTDEPVAVGLAEATAMEFAPNGDLWVLEQDGLVKRFRPGSTSADVVGNIANLGINSSGERGLLGIAFHPDYVTNKQVYLYYTVTSATLHNRISHFRVIDVDPEDYYFAGANAFVADAGSSGTPTATPIFDLDTLGATNHNGGAIHFGPDGKLYAAVGDNAVGSNAQSLSNVLGKILRMNDDGSAPRDNPYIGVTSGKQEAIWAIGLRNPFTFAFQPGTGRMFINDVGQNAWEEIDEGSIGSNYGWPAMEGNHGTPSPFYVGPIYEYPHGTGTFEGFAITGGAFYNPAVRQFPAEYVGDYFFADFSMSWINVLDVESGAVARFGTDVGNVVDLRVTNDGSFYYLSRGGGQVVRVNFPSVCIPGDPSDNELPWQNGLDVDDDCEITPNDALTIINYINAFEAGPVPSLGWGPPYLDVTEDGHVAPDDALTIINHINAFGTGPAGENYTAESSADPAFDLLAADVAEAVSRRRK